jgi:hypothetical protein
MVNYPAREARGSSPPGCYTILRLLIRDSRERIAVHTTSGWRKP